MNFGQPGSLRPAPQRASIGLASLDQAWSEYREGAFCHCSSGCKSAAAVAGSTRDAVTVPPLSIWLPDSTKSFHRSPASSYRDFPSLVSRQASCRYVSGSAGAARLAPYPICLPSLPWRYALGVVAPLTRCASNRTLATSRLGVKVHQRPTASLARRRRGPSSAFLRYDDCSSSLATKDHVEVCSLSRQATLQPVSPLLLRSLRFLHDPVPAAPIVFLTVHLPSPAALRAYPVSHAFQSGAGPSIPPAAPRPRTIIGNDPFQAAYHFGQAFQHLWLVWYDDVYERFTSVGRSRSSLAPLRLGASRVRCALRLGVPRFAAGTLSPKLHTVPLPAPRVRIGNGWWNNRFRQVMVTSAKQKLVQLSGRTAEVPLISLLLVQPIRRLLMEIPLCGGWGAIVTRCRQQGGRCKRSQKNRYRPTGDEPRNFPAHDRKARGTACLRILETVQQYGQVGHLLRE